MFCGHGSKFLSPLLLRGTNGSSLSNSFSHIFWLTLKGTSNAPAVDLLRLNTPRGTKTTFLTPKRYYEHPCHFYMEVLPSGNKCIGLGMISIMFRVLTVMEYICIAY